MRGSRRSASSWTSFAATTSTASTWTIIFYPYPEYLKNADFPDDPSWKRYQDAGGKLGRALTGAATTSTA